MQHYVRFVMKSLNNCYLMYVQFVSNLLKEFIILCGKMKDDK